MHRTGCKPGQGLGVQGRKDQEAVGVHCSPAGGERPGPDVSREVPPALCSAEREHRDQNGRLQLGHCVRAQLLEVPVLGPDGHHGEHEEGDGICQALDPVPGHHCGRGHVVDECDTTTNWHC